MPMDDATYKALEAWHGSPHDFDRFQWDKIGTGEGAQVYSYGPYLAGKRPIAEHYRDALTDTRAKVMLNGQPLREHLEPVVEHHGMVSSIENDLGLLRKAIQENESQGLTHFGGLHPDNAVQRTLKGVPLQQAKDHAETLQAHADLFRPGIEASHAQFQAKTGEDLPRNELDVHRLHNILHSVERAGLSPVEAWQEQQELEGAIAGFVPEDLRPDYTEGDAEREQEDIKRSFDRIKPIVDKLEVQKGNGRLYQVELNAGEHNMLNWDEPHILAHPRVKEKLKDHVPAHSKDTGKDIWKNTVQMMKSQGNNHPEEAASRWLFSKGIHGMKYLDASSRHIPAPRWDVRIDDREYDPIEYADLEDEDYDAIRTIRPLVRHSRQITNHKQLQERLEENLNNALDRMREAEQGAKQYDPNTNAAKTLQKEMEEFMDRAYELENAIGWFRNNGHDRITFHQEEDRRSFNYVMYDDGLIKMLKKYGMKGELLHDYGHGVNLKPVEHDPFKGT